VGSLDLPYRFVLNLHRTANIAVNLCIAGLSFQRKPFVKLQ
jgi:hypothetical protein